MKYNMDKSLSEYWMRQINVCLMHQINTNFRREDIQISSFTEQKRKNDYHPSFKLTIDAIETEVVLKTVGFSGKAGSGKDTSADIYKATLQSLINEKIRNGEALATNYIIHRDAFASVLKELCSVLSDTPVDLFNDPEGKKKENVMMGMTNRKVAQIVGTECFRDTFDENIWVRTVINNTVREILEQQMHFSKIFEVKPRTLATLIVSDVRFENEANMFRALEGDLAMVINENQKIDESVDSHRSEQLFDLHPADKVIRNNGVYLSDLANEVLDAFMRD